MSVEKGQIYRHFKNRLVKVTEIAKSSETLEEMIVYYHIDEENPSIWVRPLSMFLSKVDKEKYPEVTQEYRFELVEK